MGCFLTVGLDASRGAETAEAETAGLFHNAQTAIPIKRALVGLGHPQKQPTPIRTDNSTANSFIQNNLTMKRTKSWDMRYHWLRDRQLRRQFNVYWNKGINNDADYFTKHHLPKIHQEKRKLYIHSKKLQQIHLLQEQMQSFTSGIARVC